MKKKGTIALLLTIVTIISTLTGCGSKQSSVGGSGEVITKPEVSYKTLDEKAATEELNALYRSISVTDVKPQLDVNMEEGSVASSLASIDTFPITVSGGGEIDIEIAAATEFSAKAPDDWLNVVAESFNKKKFEVNGKRVTVSIRKMSSGEVLTYMADGNYRPDCYIPSNDAWGKMLQARGISTITVKDRIAGNTAGILMKKSVSDKIVEKYGVVTVATVLQAAIDGELTFAYTNPYTSSTGLNILSAMLYAFNNDNPLSDESVAKLVEYQKNAPTAAYTTSVLKNSAAKGIIDAMVMEEQAYINTAELRDYIYTPAGIRHDHPVLTFDYVSEERREAVNMFAEFCLTDENQKLATERGFNRHEEYKSQPNGMDGNGYLAAQRVWKKNKNGGRPVVAVFVADVSVSMGKGGRLNALQQSLLSTMQYIDESNYIGLVSYGDNVFVNLPIDRFDDKQRAYFSGAVKGLELAGNTATYDATIVGLKMLLDAKEQVPNAQLMLFVLSDGDQNRGFTLDRIAPVVSGLKIPVFTIGYMMGNDGRAQLKKLAEINEAACIDSDVEGIVNDLRNLFNVNM